MGTNCRRKRKKEEGRVDVILIGDGPIHDELASEALPEFVHLMGFRRNVVDYYHMSDLGILPTVFQGESFPLTIIECFMAGRPMLATNLGEIKKMLMSPEGELAGELLEVSNGIIDLERALGSLVELVENERSYKKKARLAEKTASRFEMESTARQYLEVYSRTSDLSQVVETIEPMREATAIIKQSQTPMGHSMV